jgi:hypothetical protein
MPPDRDLFLSQCKRVFGKDNPERMRMAHWEWMVRTGAGPWGVRDELGLEHHVTCFGENSCDDRDPDWCFHRFGMSRTPMPDGRVIHIAGEHEDSYDPDFCIYNDVIVLRPEDGIVDEQRGHVEIYGYPRDVFPPTDFHSATLVEREILVIGNLGYPETRDVSRTPIYALDTDSYQIREVRTTGTMPGWIREHHASYDASRHAITVRGGKRLTASDKQNPPRRSVHRLHLEDGRWELVKNHETWSWIKIRAQSKNYFGDIPALESLRPDSIPHQWIAPGYRGNAYSNWDSSAALDIEGVRVTLDPWGDELRVEVEGELPLETLGTLASELTTNLEKATRAKWKYFVPGERPADW